METREEENFAVDVRGRGIKRLPIFYNVKDRFVDKVKGSPGIRREGGEVSVEEGKKDGRA